MFYFCTLKSSLSLGLVVQLVRMPVPSTREGHELKKMFFYNMVW